MIIGILAAIAFLILQAILEALNFLSQIEPCDILNFLRDFSFNVQARMCEETNNEAKFGRALAEAMGKEAFAKICVQLLGEGTKPDDIRDISCAACSLLSPEQYLGFLSGNPDRETTNIVGNYIRTRNMQEPEQTQQFSECGDGRLPEGSIRKATSALSERNAHLISRRLKFLFGISRPLNLKAPNCRAHHALDNLIEQPITCAVNQSAASSKTGLGDRHRSKTDFSPKGQTSNAIISASTKPTNIPSDISRNKFSMVKGYGENQASTT